MGCWRSSAIVRVAAGAASALYLGCPHSTSEAVVPASVVGETPVGCRTAAGDVEAVEAPAATGTTS